MPLVRGVFFDLDGTLVDTYEADFLAYRDAINEVTDVNITADQFAKTHGQEAKQKFITLGLDLSSAQIAKIAESKKHFYRSYSNHTKSIDNMVNLLRHITADHVTVLVTTAKKHNAEMVLKKHNISELFNYFVFGDDVKQTKPDPEAYQLALSKSGLSPNEVLAFEDSDSGVAAAMAAGLNVIRVPKPR
jgi:HAD superfamily hydrolase (TIGR01509 family)